MVFLELEDEDGTTEVQPRVQGRGGEVGAGSRGSGGACADAVSGRWLVGEHPLQSFDKVRCDHPPPPASGQQATNGRQSPPPLDHAWSMKCTYDTRVTSVTCRICGLRYTARIALAIQVIAATIVTRHMVDKLNVLHMLTTA